MKIIIACFVVLTLVTAVYAVKLDTGIGEYETRIERGDEIEIPVTITLTGTLEKDYRVIASIIPNQGMSCENCTISLSFSSDGIQSAFFILKADNLGVYSKPFTVNAISSSFIVSIQTAKDPIEIVDLIQPSSINEDTNTIPNLASSNTPALRFTGQGTVKGDDYYTTIIEMGLFLTGIKLDAIEIEDDREAGGLKTLLMSHATNSGLLKSAGPDSKVLDPELSGEMGTVFGAFLSAKKAQMDIDELKVIVIDDMAAPIGVYYCKKKWFDAFAAGELTLQDVSNLVLDSLTNLGEQKPRFTFTGIPMIVSI